MLGSIFKINDIYYSNKHHIWIIHMILCGDYDQNLKLIFNYIKNEYSHSETGLLSFGRVLRQMGKFNEAEKYYLKFLNQK